MKYKKIILIQTLFIIFALTVFSQTEKIETQYLQKKFENKEITQLEYQQIARDWHKLLNDLGGYPKLPYNENTSMIEFNILKSYPGINKEILFNRIIEWSAINFGSLSSVLHYKNFETGKIILKGSFDLSYKKDIKSYSFFGEEKEKETVSSINCYQTYIFTIKENKVKIEVKFLNYKYTTGGYTLSTMYVPESEHEISIHSLYPIASGKNSFYGLFGWKGRLSILNQTNEEINTLVNRVDNYIKNFESDYKF